MKLASLIVMLHSDLPDTPRGDIRVLKYSICATVNTASCSTWRQSTAVINRADRRLTAAVVNCCKQNATVGCCCSQSLSVVLTTPKLNRRRACFFARCDIPDRSSPLLGAVPPGIPKSEILGLNFGHLTANSSNSLTPARR